MELTLPRAPLSCSRKADKEAFDLRREEVLPKSDELNNRVKCGFLPTIQN